MRGREEKRSEIEREQESDIIEVLLDCDAYFFTFLCDICPRTVHILKGAGVEGIKNRWKQDDN